MSTSIVIIILVEASTQITGNYFRSLSQMREQLLKNRKNNNWEIRRKILRVSPLLFRFLHKIKLTEF